MRGEKRPYTISGEDDGRYMGLNREVRSECATVSLRGAQAEIWKGGTRQQNISYTTDCYWYMKKCGKHYPALHHSDLHHLQAEKCLKKESRGSLRVVPKDEYKIWDSKYVIHKCVRNIADPRIKHEEAPTHPSYPLVILTFLLPMHKICARPTPPSRCRVVSSTTSFPFQPPYPTNLPP